MKTLSFAKAALAALVLSIGLAASVAPASADVVVVNGRHGYYDHSRHFHEYSQYHGRYGYWRNHSFIQVGL